MEQPWGQPGLGPDHSGERFPPKNKKNMNMFVKSSTNPFSSQAGLFYVTSISSTSLVSGLAYTLLRFKNKPYDEALGAAQFTERTSISCHKLS